jgi:hypothetical protein
VAWFSLHGEVNSRNSWYWSAEKSELIQKLPLCDEKVDVWCSVSASHGITTISGQELQKVNNVPCSCTEYIQSGGQHFQHLL